jgi:type I restriction enzyme R subunit
LNALVHEPTLKLVAGAAVFNKARLIITLGDSAVHSRPVQPVDGLNAVRELFHVCFWFARTYARADAHTRSSASMPTHAQDQPDSQTDGRAAPPT